MHYFVTGATGYIGSRLAQRLVEDNHQVTALVRDPAKATTLAEQGVRLVQGDITQKESMRAAMAGSEEANLEGAKVDGVFHLAAMYALGQQDNHRMQAVNVEGTRNVLELAQECGIARVVYTSTATVFSNTHGQVVDETYHHAYEDGFVNEYERSKWLAHYHVAQPMMQAGLPLIIVMPSLVYGEDDSSAIGNMLRQYLQGNLHFSPKHCAYSWAHVEDVVNGHILAMEKGTLGQEYILSGVNASLESVLELAQAITGIPAPRLRLSPSMMRATEKLAHLANAFYPLSTSYHPEVLRSTAGVTYLSSHAKASTALGYEVRSLREGLRTVLEHELSQLS